MSRKVFLSFLGTGKYKKCIYSSSDKGDSKVVEYVQEAILDLYANDFQQKDVAFIFLTKDAEERHWSNLQERLQKLPFQVLPVKNMPEGYTENHIWEIFDNVFSKIEKNDEIILDVTHGFRSLPMLGIVLLNYAKALKKIKIQNILYGAFEALGPAYDIDVRIPNPEDRKAPLLDLSAFSAIQTWSFAADTFVQTGNPQLIAGLTSENINPILKASRGQDRTANSIRNLINNLSVIERDLSTNRGQNINRGDSITSALTELDSLIGDNQHIFTLLSPVLQTIKNKLSLFQNKAPWQASVEWCIEHGLIQQGITQLQEGIITFVANEHNLDPNMLINREIVAQALNIHARDIKEENWNSPASDHKSEVKKILKNEFVINHKDNFQRLSECRNDINHGGYKKSALSDGKRFQEKLEFIYSEFIKISSDHSK